MSYFQLPPSASVENIKSKNNIEGITITESNNLAEPRKFAFLRYQLPPKTVINKANTISHIEKKSKPFVADERPSRKNPNATTAIIESRINKVQNKRMGAG